jgi:3-oxoadipate enol-lactonase
MPTAKVNGVNLYYELAGTGLPLVLVHGLQGDSTTFGQLPQVLARHFTVLTFDQRGSGLSEKPAGPLSTDLLADDTAALVRHLNLDPAAVFGTSMGGQVAQAVALRHPALVLRLILGCTTPGGPHAVPVRRDALDFAYTMEPLSAEERARRLAEVAFSPVWLAEHPEVVGALVQARRERPLDLDALSRRLEAFLVHDTFDALPGLRAPTLVVTGSPDALIPEANSRLLAEHLPQASLTILQPAGHLFWIERPEETIEALVGFLSAGR